MNKTTKIILFSIAVIVIVALVVSLSGNTPKTTGSSKAGNSIVSTTQNSSVSVNNSANSGGITLSDLAMHSSKEDCWVVYKGKVYDVTSWLTKHPGGVNAIARYCGTQGFEDAFIRQHGTSKASFFLQVAKLIGDFKLQGSIS